MRVYVTDINGIKRTLNAAAKDAKRRWEAGRNAARLWALNARGQFVETHLSGSPVHRWTGQLARSLKSLWEPEGASFRAGVAFDEKMRGPSGEFRNYANALEYGAVIRPKNAKLLAFPVSGGPAETSGHIARYASPRQFPGKLFFFRAHSGKMFLATTNGGSMKLVYHLSESVRIPAIMGFRAWGQRETERGYEAVKHAVWED